MNKNNNSFFVRFALRVEDVLMTRMVSKDRPGALLKRLFKIPVLFYKIGLPLFGGFILLLTTTGRKSGEPRPTPLEYRRDPVSNERIITAGWGGNTDWRRNLEANPHVHVQAGKEHYNALAERLSDDEVAAFLTEAMRVNPRSAKMWSRWAGEPVGIENPESVLRAARFFPSYRLKPGV